MEFIVLQYPRNVRFVFAPLCKDLTWQNRFSMTSLFTSIELLESTSILIKNFRDPRPISDSSDVRLTENETTLHWFCSWESEVKESSVSATFHYPKHLLLDGSAFWIHLLKKSVQGSIFGELGKDL
jgi:hypothetical protein